MRKTSPIMPLPYYLCAVSLGLTAALPASFAQGPPATKVVLGKAEAVDAPVTITLVGSLTPVRQSRIGSEVEGLIDDMPVRQGDMVKAGAVICQLDADTLKHQLDEAEARLGALAAALDELKAGTRKEDLRRLRAQLEEAEAEAEAWRPFPATISRTRSRGPAATT